jgi:uncharacterized protein
MEIAAYGQQFVLSATKCLFWKDESMLIIADAHFSKETHFRKNGIAIPHGILEHDLIRLQQLIQHFQPKRVLFLGDMFHSEENEGLNAFIAWRKTQQVSMELIIGNHDILDSNWYTFADIQCIQQQLLIKNIILSHDKLSVIPEHTINFYGHVHPAIRMTGNARQSLRLPCFVFSTNYAIMPAFGRFTGAKSLLPQKHDSIYAIGDNSIFKVQ